MNDRARTGISYDISQIDKCYLFFADLDKTGLAVKAEVQDRVFATEGFRFPAIDRIFKFCFGVAPVMHKRHIAVFAHQFQHGSY